MRLFDSSKKAKKQRCSESAAQPKRPCLPFAPPLLPAPHQASQARPVDGPLSVPSVPAPPAAWTTAFSQPLPSHPPPTYPHQLLPGPPIVVNQHYYIGPPPPPPPPPPQPPHNQEASGKVDLGPVVNLVENLRLGSRVPQVFDDGLPSWHGYGTQLLNQGAAFYDQISSRFDQVVTSIDWDRYAGGGGDPSDPVYAPYAAQAPQPPQPSSRASEPRVTKGDKKNPSRDGVRKGPSADVAAAVLSDNYFSKVDLYENSRLPADLPPLKLYLPTYPLLCLAAQYAERVYERPRGAEKDAFVDADWRSGTKAMVIKSISMDDVHTVVFAIRGTANFMDWAVNLNMAPASPAGFLDDAGNFCHSGFLSVARRMVAPVARRLRQLLDEDPSRASSHSLLMTGHSAGGAVAALLYCHMLAASPAASSELTALARRFRRVHCVTFGAPPVSLLPLERPSSAALQKSLFLSFVNEGDPVVRADRAYVRSLLELYAAPPPPSPSKRGAGKAGSSSCSSSTTKERRPKGGSRSRSETFSSSPSSTGEPLSKNSGRRRRPVWKVPPCTLSNAGRIVVLRSSGDVKSVGARRRKKRAATTVQDKLDEGVVAHTASDELLRTVVWGDPLCHVMRLYAGRIESLAVAAITAKGY